MRRLTTLTVFVTVLALFALPVLADTLVLKNGERVNGYFEGGTARVVKFRGSDGALKDYDILSVQQVQFGDDSSNTTLAPKPSSFTSSTTTGKNPGLRPTGSRPPANPPSVMRRIPHGPFRPDR